MEQSKLIDRSKTSANSKIPTQHPSLALFSDQSDETTRFTLPTRKQLFLSLPLSEVRRNVT